MTSLYSTRDEVAVAKIIARPDDGGGGGPGHEFKCLHARRPIDFLTNGGLHIALEAVRSADRGWFSVAGCLDGKSALEVGSAFERIRSVAVESGMRVLLVLTATSTPGALPMEDHCDLLLETAHCEADLDADRAFSVKCPMLASLHPIGIGASMCELKAKAGRFDSRVRPFIAATRLDRRIWISRGQGQTMAEIGVAVRMDKSSVHRRLKKMHPPRRLRLDDDWEDKLRDPADDGDVDQVDPNASA